MTPAFNKLDLIVPGEKLKRQHGAGPSHDQGWCAANGRIPARREGRSSRVSKTDLPSVAEHFQVAPTAPDAA